MNSDNVTADEWRVRPPAIETQNEARLLVGLSEIANELHQLVNGGLTPPSRKRHTIGTLKAALRLIRDDAEELHESVSGISLKSAKAFWDQEGA